MSLTNLNEFGCDIEVQVDSKNILHKLVIDGLEIEDIDSDSPISINFLPNGQTTVNVTLVSNRLKVTTVEANEPSPTSPKNVKEVN